MKKRMPLAIALAAVLSVIANLHRVNELGLSATVTKKLTFLLSYLVFFYLFQSGITRRADVNRLLRVLVGGGAFVAFFGLVEFRTHFNLFDHLSTVMPFLHLEDRLTSADIGRGGRAGLSVSALPGSSRQGRRDSRQLPHNHRWRADVCHSSHTSYRRSS